MDDTLRSEIWDYLSTAIGPQSFDDIARCVGRDADAVRGVVNHEWFELSGDLVSIAYVGQSGTSSSAVEID